MKTIKTITAKEIEEVLQINFSDYLRHRCTDASLDYEEINSEDRDNYIREVVNILSKVDIDSDNKPAGESRLQEWEIGWNENLISIKKGTNVNNLIPKYFGKHELSRWKQRIIRPISRDFDYKILSILVDWAIETFFKDLDVIYEFGCGPAYHLLRVRKIFPNVKLVGLDWTKTSQEIIRQIFETGLDHNIEAYNFNFFQPDYLIEVPPKSGFLTVAALEQVGSHFDQFLEFIMEKKPSICVHFEPIDELLDQTNLIDRLSILYFRKRNYLSGFLSKLRELQAEDKIEIIKEQRTFSGSFFIEGHSLIVWRPR
jgi:hypothetical protein